MEKNVIYAGQCHVWTNAMYDATTRSCAVVTYGKNVTYALAGLQGSEWLSRRTLAERPAPHCGELRARWAQSGLQLEVA